MRSHRGRFEVFGMRGRKRGDRGIVTCAAEIRNQDGAVVQTGEHILMLRRRTPAPASHSSTERT